MLHREGPRNIYLLLLLILVCACNVRPTEDPIVRPVISAAFYQESARQLEEELKTDTANFDYIRLQLDYYQRLNWPPAASRAVARARKVLPLDPLVAKMYADYYFKNAQFTALNGLFDQLDTTFFSQNWMDRYRVKTYLEMGQSHRAVAVLEGMMGLYGGDRELAFWAGKVYLSAADTASAFLYLREARDDYRLDEEFLRLYLPLLLHQQKLTEVIYLSEDYLFAVDATPSMRLFLAQQLYAAGAMQFAKDQVWQSINREGLFVLSHWYQWERKWDSAHYCLDRILLANDADLPALLRKGEVDHTRGWLARSLRYYERVLEVDSTNVTALAERDQINRKIAYLRRIREAQRDIPVLDLEGKKEVN